MKQRRKEWGDIVTREQVVSLITRYFSQQISDDEKVAALNHFRQTLHELSPFSREPVDLVLWVKAGEVVANDYNPNVMAAGEKKIAAALTAGGRFYPARRGI